MHPGRREPEGDSQLTCLWRAKPDRLTGMTLAYPVPAANRGRFIPVVEGDKMDKDLKSRGMENEIEGKAKEMKGNLRGDLGDATDNTSEHIKGRKEQLEGKIQKNFGKTQQNLDPDEV